MDEQKIQQVSRLILQNKSGMVQEQDIINLFPNTDEYAEAIKQIVFRYRQIGLSLVRTDFKGKKYYVVSSPGKDDQISPAMYGALGIIVAMYNELGTVVSISKLKEVLSDVWNEIELLQEANYLEEHEENGEKKLILTPLAKAATQKIAGGLKIRDFIDLE